MAKKKTHAKKAAPAKKEKSSSLGWIVAAIVVIAVVAFLLMRPATKVEVKEEVKAPEVAPDKAMLTGTDLPEFQKKCLNAIGVVPGTQTEENGVLSVTFKNNGRTAIEGTYFEFTDADGERRFKKNSESVEAGATIAYKVDLNQVASELNADIKDFILYSVEGGKACENQRRFVMSR